jgi:hypothetical protein
VHPADQGGAGAMMTPVPQANVIPATVGAQWQLPPGLETVQKPEQGPMGQSAMAPVAAPPAEKGMGVAAKRWPWAPPWLTNVSEWANALASGAEKRIAEKWNAPATYTYAPGTETPKTLYETVKQQLGQPTAYQGQGWTAHNAPLTSTGQAIKEAVQPLEKPGTAIGAGIVTALRAPKALWTAGGQMPALRPVEQVVGAGAQALGVETSHIPEQVIGATIVNLHPATRDLSEADKFQLARVAYSESPVKIAEDAARVRSGTPAEQVAEERYNVLRETVGQTIINPLNLMDLAAMVGKVVGWQVRAAEGLVGAEAKGKAVQRVARVADKIDEYVTALEDTAKAEEVARLEAAKAGGAAEWVTGKIDEYTAALGKGAPAAPMRVKRGVLQAWGDNLRNFATETPHARAHAVLDQTELAIMAPLAETRSPQEALATIDMLINDPEAAAAAWGPLAKSEAGQKARLVLRAVRDQLDRFASVQSIGLDEIYPSLEAAEQAHRWNPLEFTIELDDVLDRTLADVYHVPIGKDPIAQQASRAKRVMALVYLNYLSNPSYLAKQFSSEALVTKLFDGYSIFGKPEERAALFKRMGIFPHRIFTGGIGQGMIGLAAPGLEARIPLGAEAEAEAAISGLSAERKVMSKPLLPGKLGEWEARAAQVTRRGEPIIPFSKGRSLLLGEESRWDDMFAKAASRYHKYVMPSKLPIPSVDMLERLGPEKSRLVVRAASRGWNLEEARAEVQKVLGARKAGQLIDIQQYIDPTLLNGVDDSLVTMARERLAELPGTATVEDAEAAIRSITDDVQRETARKLSELITLPDIHVATEAEWYEGVTAALYDVARAGKSAGMTPDQIAQVQQIIRDLAQATQNAHIGMMEAPLHHPDSMYVLISANKDVSALRENARLVADSRLLQTAQVYRTIPGLGPTEWAKYFAWRPQFEAEVSQSIVARYTKAAEQLKALAEPGATLEKILGKTPQMQAEEMMIRLTDERPFPEGYVPITVSDPAEEAKFVELRAAYRSRVDAAATRAWRAAVRADPSMRYRMLDVLDSASRDTDVYAQQAVGRIAAARDKALAEAQVAYEAHNMRLHKKIWEDYYGLRNDLWKKYYSEAITRWKWAETDALTHNFSRTRMGGAGGLGAVTPPEAVPVTEAPALPAPEVKAAEAVAPSTGASEIAAEAVKHDPTQWTPAEAAAVAEHVDATPQSIVEAPWPPDAPVNRDTVWRALSQDVYPNDPEAAKQTMAVYDAFAKATFGETGRPPEEWYEWIIKYFGLGKGEGPGLAQRSIYENTPEFKTWFGASKVVDEAGKPMVVYHAPPTTIPEFTEFRPGYGGVSWFSDNPEYVDRLRGYVVTGMPPEYYEGQRTLPIYLSLKNPLDLTELAPTYSSGPGAGEALRDILARRGFDTDFVFTNPNENAGTTFQQINKQLNNGFRERAIAKGYDGIIIREYGPYTSLGPVESKSYLTFSPDQIKSVANVGTFGATPNILQQAHGLGMVEVGKTQFAADGKAVVSFLKARDKSTGIHEGAHLFLESMLRMMDEFDVPVLKTRFGAVEKWLGTDGDLGPIAQLVRTGGASEEDAARYEAAQEKFARGFEAYMREGTAPSDALREAFEMFKQWLRQIYETLKGSEIDKGLSDPMRGFFDEMLAGTDVRSTAKVEAATKGRGAVVWVDPARKYNVRYAVMDLNDVLASHTADLQTMTPTYPAYLQQRYLDRTAMAQRLDKMARELDADELLAVTPSLERGAPIIGSDGAVEVGNSRILALRKAAAEQPANYAAYKKALLDRAGEFGFKRTEIEGIENPVLVRVRETPVDRAAFAREGNQPVAMQMVSSELARADAARVSDAMIGGLTVGENQTIDEALRSAANRHIVRSFLADLAPTELNALVDENGVINQAGIARIKAALLASTYPGDSGRRLLQLMTESADSNIKNLENAIFASLPDMSKAEAMIRAGQREQNLSIGEDVVAAALKLSVLRQEGTPALKYLAQAEMFGAELTTTQRSLLWMMSEATPTTMRSFFKEYARLVIESGGPGQRDMFAAFNVTKPTKADYLAQAFGKVAPQKLIDKPRPQGILFQKRGQPAALQLGMFTPAEAPKRGQLPEEARGFAPPEQMALPGTEERASAAALAFRNAAREGEWVQTPDGLGLIQKVGDSKSIIYFKDPHPRLVEYANETLTLPKAVGGGMARGGAIGTQGTLWQTQAPLDPRVNRVARLAQVNTVGHFEYAPMEEIILNAQRDNLQALEQIIEGIKRDWGKVLPQVVDNQARNAVWTWFNKEFRPAFLTSKASALQYGQEAANFAMLDYEKTRGFDLLLRDNFLPFHYWYTRGGWNWARRFAQRPALLFHYLRIKNAMNLANQNAGRRARFNQSLPINAGAILPDWMGDEAYVNLIYTALPFANIFGTGYEDPQQGAGGLQSVWQAAQDLGMRPYPWFDIPMAIKVFQNIADAANAKHPEMFGPTVPGNVGYFLPQTRMIQGATAALREAVPATGAVIPPGGIVLENLLRSAIFLPRGEVWDPYRVTRAIGVMAGEHPQDAQLAATALDAEELVKNDMEQHGQRGEPWKSGDVVALKTALAQNGGVWNDAVIDAGVKAGWHSNMGSGSVALKTAAALGWTVDRLVAAQAMVAEGMQRASLEMGVRTAGRTVGVGLSVQPKGEQNQIALQKLSQQQAYSPETPGGSYAAYRAFKAKYPSIYPRIGQYATVPTQEETTGMTPGQRANWFLQQPELADVNALYDREIETLLRSRPFDAAGPFGTSGLSKLESERYDAINKIKAKYPIGDVAGQMPTILYGMSPREQGDASVEAVIRTWTDQRPKQDDYRSWAGIVDYDAYDAALAAWKKTVPQTTPDLLTAQALPSRYGNLPLLQAIDAYDKRYDTPLIAMAKVYQAIKVQPARDAMTDWRNRTYVGKNGKTVHYNNDKIKAESIDKVRAMKGTDLINDILRAYPAAGWTRQSLERDLAGITFPAMRTWYDLVQAEKK